MAACRSGFNPTIRVRIKIPTYREVGSGDLVGNIDRPTYREVGSGDLVGNIDRPTYAASRAWKLDHRGLSDLSGRQV
jgi:hypothetical protein